MSQRQRSRTHTHSCYRAGLFYEPNIDLENVFFNILKFTTSLKETDYIIMVFYFADPLSDEVTVKVKNVQNYCRKEIIKGSVQIRGGRV